ncbi:GNAT family N-acetyltransferase [Paenibacillus lautus]|jgi:[ribosomal protein S5]-alanine N-acetyltransferase|uniref:GNAT family N-acetyltransferase n=1 Tax=Paenibacillus lautus TaxID=1401 RepID=UPI003D28890A
MNKAEASLPILTDRLMIRRLTRDDFEHIYALCLQAYTNDWPSGWKMNKQQASDFLDWQISKYKTFNVVSDAVYFAVVTRDESIFVGHCHVGVIEELSETEIGYGISKHFRGFGYATEVAIALTQWALNTFNIHYVIATIVDDNPHSLKVIEKAGFINYGKKQLGSVGEQMEYNYFRYYNPSYENRYLNVPQ